MEKGMTLEQIFCGVDTARIAVLGDFCLDAYWFADMKQSQLSREVPHFPLPVVSERYSAGGAGNVACNVAALEPGSVKILGVIGTDWRGTMLKKCLAENGIDPSGLCEDAQRVTNTYIKPMRMGISETIYEDPRLDFENHAPLSEETEDRLIEALRALDADVLCVCEQMFNSCVTSRVRETLCALGEAGMTILVDSRDRIGEYRNVIVKPNEVEAARALNSGEPYEKLVEQLSERTGRPAIITLGAQGCLLCEDGAVCAVPARKVQPPIDICGAGDAFLASIACALAAGAKLQEAAWFANTAAAITTTKLNMTGTASRTELREWWNR